MGISTKVSGNLGAKDVIINVTNGVGSPYQITPAQSQITFQNQGATAEVYLNLPASPNIGDHYRGASIDSDGMRFVAQGSQTITDGTTISGAGGYVQLVGNSAVIDLVYIVNNRWVAISDKGTLNIV